MKLLLAHSAEHLRPSLEKNGVPVDEILVTNTLPQIPHPGIRTLDIVPMLLSKRA